MIRFSVLPGDFNRDLFSRLNRVFGDLEESGMTAEWAPAVDIKEEDDKYVVSADIPGVDPNDIINVTLENNILTISGRRESEKKEEKEGYRRIERSKGQFLRRFVLPETVDDTKVSADNEKGVLYVTIPKSAKQKAKRIKVNS